MTDRTLSEFPAPRRKIHRQILAVVSRGFVAYHSLMPLSDLVDEPSFESFAFLLDVAMAVVVRAPFGPFR
jgi:hypothetical protein